MVEFIQDYWMQALWTVLLALATWSVRKASKKVLAMKEEQDAIKDGLLAIGHDRLYQACKFHIKNKGLTAEQLKNLEYLYDGYSRLGGNGTGTALYEKCRALPIIEED